MAEENKAQENTGIDVPGEAKPLSRIQEEAIQQGWRPREDFDGEEDEFIDAPEFVRRGELFRKIEAQSKEMKDMKRALQHLAKHNQEIAKVEYEKALKDLRAQKKEALAEGDADRVVEVDERIDLVKDQQKILQQQQLQQVQEQVLNPEFAAWTSKNQWYETDKRMRAYADSLGISLAQDGMSPSDVLKEVEKEVKQRYPEKFRNPNRDKPGAVEGARARPNARSADDSVEMSDDQKKIMNTIVNSGAISREEYLKQFKAIQGR